jgi:hypothetical protein
VVNYFYFPTTSGRPDGSSSSSKVGVWEREELGKTVPQPKGNFLMELTDLPFHGSE